MKDHWYKTNYKYYNIHDFHTMKNHWYKTNNFSLFHTNICSLNANDEQLSDLLSDLEFKFDLLLLKLGTLNTKVKH